MGSPKTISRYPTCPAPGKRVWQIETKFCSFDNRVGCTRKTGWFVKRVKLACDLSTRFPGAGHFVASAQKAGSRGSEGWKASSGHHLNKVSPSSFQKGKNGTTVDHRTIGLSKKLKLCSCTFALSEKKRKSWSGFHLDQIWCYLSASQADHASQPSW